MTAADRTRGYYARCVPLLARLRLPASQNAGAPLPPGAKRATRPVPSWPKRAPPGKPPWPPSRKAAAGPRPCSWPPRQARLAAAADSIVAAAEDGSAAALSRPLRRFEALSSALWTVQPAPAVPAARGPSGP